MNKLNEGTWPDIEGTELIETKSGDMKRIITSVKAKEALASKGVELGATYELVGPKNDSITIAGISDDMFGFDPDDSQEAIKNLRPNRASIWVYVGDDTTIGFYGYVKDFENNDELEGFDMNYNSMKIKHKKIENTRVPKVVQSTNTSAMDLL